MHTKVKWVANDRAVIFFDSLQAIEYNKYCFSKLKGLSKMRRELMNGYEIQGWPDVFALARKYEGIGVSCSLAKSR